MSGPTDSGAVQLVTLDPLAALISGWLDEHARVPLYL
jgi:hypothetical protein